LVILSMSLSAFSHSGRTDKNGGHYDRKTGKYHYHSGSKSKSSSNSLALYNPYAYTYPVPEIVPLPQAPLLKTPYDWSKSSKKKEIIDKNKYAPYDLLDVEELFNEGYFNYYGSMDNDVDFDKAFYCLSKASIMEHELAIFQLARCYENGNGTGKDLSMAIKLYEKSFNKGHTYSAVKLGNLYNNKKDIENAVFWFNKAIENGEPLLNIPQDKAITEKLGSTYTDFTELQTIFSTKMNTIEEDDFYKLLYKFTDISNKGNSLATVIMADMYKQACERDFATPEKTVKYKDNIRDYYEKASKQGHSEASYILGYEYFNDNSEIVSFDITKGLNYLKIAAKRGNVDAQYQLGLCYETGKGVTIDKKEAAKWYREATFKGNKPAAAKLSDFYYNGFGVKKDLQKSKYYKDVANKDT